MEMKTLRIPAELMGELESAAKQLSAFDPCELRFRRRSNRCTVSVAEVAQVALEIGLDELLGEHGLGPELPELSREAENSDGGPDRLAEIVARHSG